MASTFHGTYPVASLAYSVGLTMLLAFLAVWLAKVAWLARVASRLDIYLVYLLHQPFAFPLALLMTMLFGKTGLILGFVIFLGVVAIVLMVFGTILRQIEAGKIRVLRSCYNLRVSR